MTYDLMHAIVTAALMFVIIVAMRKAGLYFPHKDGGPRFSWPLFFAIGAAVFILNLLWP